MQYSRSMASPASVNDNGRNCCQLVCIRCQSKILPPNTGIFEVLLESAMNKASNYVLKDIEYELESFNKETAGEKEKVKGFYRVGDMFDFDNLGFTNTVGGIKYLSCADCDVGPIGYHDLSTKIR